jgi:hypothetical protein
LSCFVFLLSNDADYGPLECNPYWLWSANSDPGVPTHAALVSAFRPF